MTIILSKWPICHLVRRLILFATSRSNTCCTYHNPIGFNIFFHCHDLHIFYLPWSLFCHCRCKHFNVLSCNFRRRLLFPNIQGVKNIKNLYTKPFPAGNFYCRFNRHHVFKHMLALQYANNILPLIMYWHYVFMHWHKFLMASMMLCV